MAFAGVTSQQYEDFLKNGGELTLTLDREDFSRDGKFESFPNLKDRLDTGFELRPSLSIYEPSEYAQVIVQGHQWPRTIAYVYFHGGSIIYRRLPTGRYEAKLMLPTVVEQPA